MGGHSSCSWIVCKGPEVSWLDMTLQTRKAAEQTKGVKKNINWSGKSNPKCKMGEKQVGKMVLFYTSISLIARQILKNQGKKYRKNPTANQIKDGL